MPRTPDVSQMKSNAGSVTAPVSIEIDARGADPAGLAKVEQQLKDLQAKIPSKVIETIRKAQKSNMKF